MVGGETFPLVCVLLNSHDRRNHTAACGGDPI